ncbi:IS701 family transposase [Spirosoma linguale]|uniref:Transposase IS4 family protein n=1 Tax=Spirosoma linguale (strain ATCC 33905 / DSM 74 / LMG 10896 / Claus 1) TaxID=504472 RepID=D2QVC6_SPILD|nr:transposase IS4 family protein [Spirosoma linguale DSM 74]
MISKKDYVEYLISTPFNYTCTHMADHKDQVSHDMVNRFLKSERFHSGHLWALVEPHLNDKADSFLLVDDSVQDKRYARFIDLAKRQYSGNEHATINGINLVNLVHSTGNEGDFLPIDYRIYHPDTDNKTKNDHFQDMFRRAITHKHLKARTVLFDSWYASVDNLKLIHRSGWTFFTTLKSNRMISLNRDTGYQHLDDLVWSDADERTGLSVKLKELPFLVRLFKIVAPNGGIEWLITNDLQVTTNRFVAENSNAVRWQIEEFHRSFKQLTGSERCQCRKAYAQRNHLACCYHAWVSLTLKAKQALKTVYQLHSDLFTTYLTLELSNPRITAI